MIEFPISGVESYWWLPPLFTFLVAAFSSVGGLSGAFLLLPFQVSILGFTGPAVSPTNLLYNVVSIPSGVLRYARERRVIWPLAWLIVVATLPGMALGAVIRVTWLPDPGNFKIFAGAVLLYIASRLATTIFKRTKAAKTQSAADFTVDGVKWGPSVLTFRFQGESHRASVPAIFGLCLGVGVIGGTYGIGGGAIVAPFLVAVIGLPVFTIAGATLFSTFVTSIAGVLIYWALPLVGLSHGEAVTPDFLLGGLCGLGGAPGMFLSASLQRYLPARLIKAILVLLLLTVAVRYLSPLVL